MTVYTIPLSGFNETFSISLLNVTYNMTVTWKDWRTQLQRANDPYDSNEIIGSWYLDIADVNNTPLVQGLPMIYGNNLISAYGYLNIGGTLTLSSDPTYTNLGTTALLQFTA